MGKVRGWGTTSMTTMVCYRPHLCKYKANLVLSPSLAITAQMSSDNPPTVPWHIELALWFCWTKSYFINHHHSLTEQTHIVMLGHTHSPKNWNSMQNLCIKRWYHFPHVPHIPVYTDWLSHKTNGRTLVKIALMFAIWVLYHSLNCCDYYPLTLQLLLQGVITAVIWIELQYMYLLMKEKLKHPNCSTLHLSDVNWTPL